MIPCTQVIRLGGNKMITRVSQGHVTTFLEITILMLQEAMGELKIHTSVIGFSSVTLGVSTCPGAPWCPSVSSCLVCDTFKAGFLPLSLHPSLCTDSCEQH
jgi:hypothetical protein